MISGEPPDHLAGLPVSLHRLPRAAEPADVRERAARIGQLGVSFSHSLIVSGSQLWLSREERFL